MKSYVLFIFGEFDDHQNVEFFINDVLGSTKTISSLRYVIEDFKNLIIIFDSKLSYNELGFEMSELLKTEHIKFYFLFAKDGLIIANLPKELKDHIFKLKDENEYELIDFDIDIILDKIDKDGIDSLTKQEKKFLDNFGN
jgi:hypothetical protein